MDVRWLTEPTVTAHRSHAYADGAVRSLCGQRALPVEFVVDEDVPRCGNCQRVVVQLTRPVNVSTDTETTETIKYVSTEPPWQEIAVRAVMGENWTYEETAKMPLHRADVDRVVAALANAFREGILQGSPPTPTG